MNQLRVIKKDTINLKRNNKKIQLNKMHLKGLKKVKDSYLDRKY